MKILKKYKILIIIMGILLVGYNLFDKFYYPELTINKPLPNKTIVIYQHWAEKNYNEEEIKKL